MSPHKKIGSYRCSSRTARAAFSIPEALVMALMSSLLVTSMVAGLRSMSVGASHQVADSDMGMDARKGVDEMLSQMRYASGVVNSYSSGSANYTTSTSTIVMTAVGYDPNSANIVLPSVTDYLIFEYDANSKQIRETVIPGAGSKRLARSRYVIAKNVEKVDLTFRARDEFTMPVATSMLTLSAKAASSPRVTVNGEASWGTWLSTAPKSVTVTAASGSNVQVQYPVSPADITALHYIQQVDVAVNFAATDSRRSVRKLVMSGSACLRNHRDLD